MDNLNLSPDKMDALLKMAGKKLGQNPNDIKSRLENGDVNSVIGGLDAKTQNKISSVLNDPKAIASLMQNDNVKKLLATLSGAKQ